MSSLRASILQSPLLIQGMKREEDVLRPGEAEPGQPARTTFQDVRPGFANPIAGRHFNDFLQERDPESQVVVGKGSRCAAQAHALGREVASGVPYGLVSSGCQCCVMVSRASS